MIGQHFGETKTEFFSIRGKDANSSMQHFRVHNFVFKRKWKKAFSLNSLLNIPVQKDIKHVHKNVRVCSVVPCL